MCTCVSMFAPPSLLKAPIPNQLQFLSKNKKNKKTQWECILYQLFSGPIDFHHSFLRAGSKQYTRDQASLYWAYLVL